MNVEDRGPTIVDGVKSVDDIDVRALFRRALTHDDADAMRQGMEQLFGLTDGTGLSAEQEYGVRHPDYVMEMPQSNERISGRDAMRAMQEAFPTPPSIRLRRISGSGRTWVIEGVNDYGGDVWNVVLILELDEHGLILRDTRYYGQRSDPPGWRSRWVEPIERGGVNSMRRRPPGTTTSVAVLAQPKPREANP